MRNQMDLLSSHVILDCVYKITRKKEGSSEFVGAILSPRL